MLTAGPSPAPPAHRQINIVTGGTEAVLVLERQLALSGKPCTFPFSLAGADGGGRVFQQCASAADLRALGFGDQAKLDAGDGVCRTASGALEGCGPKDATTAAEFTPAVVDIPLRFTTDGEPCLLPTVDPTFGETVVDCAEVDESGVPMCQGAASGKWKACARREATVIPSGLAGAQFAIDGRPCQFPYDWAGITHRDCLSIVAGVQFCPVGEVALADGRTSLEWAECLAPEDTELGAGPVAVTGEACVFPATYRGEVITECMDIAGTPSCKVGDGSWQACAPPPPPTQTRPATAPGGGGRSGVDGRPCLFPFTFEGAVYEDCLADAGTGAEWCQVAVADYCAVAEGGACWEWTECAPVAVATASAEASPPAGEEAALPAGPSSGGIVAIVICSLLALAVLGLTAYFIFFKRRARNFAFADLEDGPATPNDSGIILSTGTPVAGKPPGDATAGAPAGGAAGP